MKIGGSNLNAGGKVKAIYADKELNSSQFTNFCRGEGGTPRQFARAMGTIIANAAMKLGEPGDFSRLMRLDQPNLSDEHAVWCSNFQSQNPDCPEVVQTWLRENYNKRFGGRGTKSSRRAQKKRLKAEQKKIIKAHNRKVRRRKKTYNKRKHYGNTFPGLKENKQLT
uniref:Uncharacterized protein n=1 Tax=Pseudopediastrum sp. CL0201VA TaxID=2184484 RepID=A0A2U8GJR6_9CHLO|nr:hypothetical protein [Pseudopediastrum sp. CL0201VA]AWI68896.1 hypothetical protein [Pseudopediastrum sp. CL0201VA]